MNAHLLPELMSQDEHEAANLHPASRSTNTRPDFCQEYTPELLQASFFAHARDNQPRPWRGSWQTLRTALGRTFTPQAGNPGGDPKRSMPAICAASFAPGATRGRDSVQGVSLLPLDFDNAREEPTGENYPGTTRPRTVKVCIPDPVTPGEVQAALQAAGVDSTGWTTWSAKPDWPKHRWIIPLASPVPVDLWERFTEAALIALGLESCKRGLDLPVLRNPAALAFLPGSPTPETIQRFGTIGHALSIPLTALPSAPAPALAPWQAAAVAERQAARANGERWFQTYRVNGRPVDFGSLDLAPILESRGVEVGSPRPFKGGTKRRAHCPWASEHTKGVDDDAVVLIQTPGSWPSFKCSHSGHGHLGLQDLIEWAWGRP
jgi:hypothetical protein